jgi:hypothetical protein
MRLPSDLSPEARAILNAVRRHCACIPSRADHGSQAKNARAVVNLDESPRNPAPERLRNRAARQAQWCRAMIGRIGAEYRHASLGAR